MLYSICSMQFWINKSNLVCAENDLSTHLCVDCISLRPERLTARGKPSLKNCCKRCGDSQVVLLTPGPAAALACVHFAPAFSLPSMHLCEQQYWKMHFIYFEYEFKFYFICIQFDKRQIAWKWSHAVLPTWPWLGNGRPGLMKPYLKLMISTRDLMHSKGWSGELRQPRLTECWCWS